MTSCLDFMAKKEGVAMDSNFTEIEINHQYGLTIPGYMRETTGLNSEASLQYQNVFNETYTIIIDEPKEEFVQVFRELDQYREDISTIKNYRDVQLQLMAERMNIETEGKPIALKINGLEAEMVELEGIVNGVDENIFYLLTFVEGNEKVYLIMSWTTASQRDIYKRVFEGIAKSFRLVD